MDAKQRGRKGTKAGSGWRRNPRTLERTTRWHPHAQRTLESSNTSEDRLHQHPEEPQMKNQGERRLTLRDNDRPKRDTQPAVQAGTSTNATSQSSPDHAGTAKKHTRTCRLRESSPRSLHVAGAEVHGSNTRRRRPSTLQSPMFPYVVRMPHVTEAA